MKSSCLIDANVIIAAYLNSNSQHNTAAKIINQLNKVDKIVNSLIVKEAATVLLLRSKNLEFTVKIVRDLFFKDERLCRVSLMSEELWQSVFDVFKNQQSHYLSFADCSLIAQARLEKIKTIATLDKDLVKEFGDEFEFITG